MIVKKQLLANIFLLEQRIDDAYNILSRIAPNASSLSSTDQAALNRLLSYVYQKKGISPPTGIGNQPQAATIALLLPLKGSTAAQAGAIKNGFFAAYYNAKQRQANSPNVMVLDTSSGNIIQTYQKAVAQGAVW